MIATTVRNVAMSALLSITVTALFAMLYVLSPLIIVWISAMFGSSETGGIGAVAGGASVTFLRTLCPIALVLFLIIFGLLQRKPIKS